MKKTTLLLMLMTSILISGYTQTTNYGTSSGTIGSYSSYFGYFAGNFATSTSFGNSFFGHQSGRYTTSGDMNTAVGMSALFRNATGYQNTSTGVYSLYRSESGYENTANGYQAMNFTSTGYGNVASGHKALFSNTTGAYNTADGARALYDNITGSYHSALGYRAGPSSMHPDLFETTALGSHATTTASNQVRIGSPWIGSIGGQVSWSTLSDGRFKKEIKEDVAGLEFINQLRPVSYFIDKEALNKFLGIPDSVTQQLASAKQNPVRQSGFVAQEVEAIAKKTGFVFHGIEAPQNKNDHYSIRYAEFVVPLVKAVQELTAKVEMQEKVAREQKVEIDALKEQLKLAGASTDGQIIPNNQVALYQNSPNPFSMDTEISMSLPETTRQATLIVYNMEGKQLKVLPINDRGKTSVKIGSNELKAGIYLYTLIVDGRVTDTKRMILTGN